MTPRDSHALSFGPAADRYDDVRPSYPAAALIWALGTAPGRVVDLGAGTGILTRVLLALGHDVVPVEPDAAMRRRLEQTCPGTKALDGGAEHIPLPDGCADAVVAGQAYHWFDTERAHPEIARVLRAGGVFAPVWNVRDESVPWVARLSELLAEPRGDRALAGRRSDELRDCQALAGRRSDELRGGGRHGGRLESADFGPLFGPVASKTFQHQVSMTADGLVALMSTRSYYLTATAARRAKLEGGIRELVAGMAEPFALPYDTVIYRAKCSGRTPSADR